MPKDSLPKFRNEKDCVWIEYNDISQGAYLVRAFLEGRGGKIIPDLMNLLNMELYWGTFEKKLPNRLKII